MNRLIFATNNINKVIELRSILDKRFEILSLSEAGIDIDIPEPFETLEENAIEKADVIYKLKEVNCFSEDTGLEVNALNGEPGVKSARYALNEKSFDQNSSPGENNIDKLLSKLQNIEYRHARFRTVICLIINGKHNIFDGECHGNITEERCGLGGFGYDSVFIPDGATQTFAEMPLQEKNKYSHRKKAIEKLIQYLNEKELVK